MLPKIDLEVEHVLIGVENRRRFSESKIGAGFRLRLERALFRGRFSEARDQ